MIVALAGFSGFLYLGAKGLESKVSDLESRTSDLETQNAELNEKVQNLTDWRDAFGDFEFSTEALMFLSLTWDTWETNRVIITVKNTGTTSLTIVKAYINYVPATMNPSSVTLSPAAQAAITLTKTEVFVSGTTYDFAFYTAIGNIFSYVATAPA